MKCLGQILNKKIFMNLVFQISSTVIHILSCQVFYSHPLATFEGFNATVLAYGQVDPIYKFLCLLK